MGVRDELRRGIGTVREAAAGIVARGVDRIASAAEPYRPLGPDERLYKAAERAKQNGKDGNHDDPALFSDDAHANDEAFDAVHRDLKRRAGVQDDGDDDAGGPPKPGQAPGQPPGKGDNGEGGDNPWTGKGIPGPHDAARDGKAVQFDPFDLVALFGWRERPSSLSYAAIERVATTTPVIADVIQARRRQVEAFCTRPDNRHSPGLKVRLKDRKQSMTPAAEKLVTELEDVLLSCGYKSDAWKGVPLKRFAGTFVRDSLTFDQGTFEIVPDRKGRPSYWRIVDPTTIRLLDPVVQQHEGLLALQVIQGVVAADFKPDELAFCTRNPRSGIYTYGYGESEIETLVREITGFLWGIEYNRRFFSQGSTTKGVLNLKGTISERELKAFRRQWYSMVSGVTNAWRTPITNAEDMQWIDLHMSNRDMEYGQWMDFLIKVVCARFQIAPEEVNFSYGNTGQKAAMGTVSVEEKLNASRDLGLRPLVGWFFECLNQNVVSRLHEDFEVVPVGFDEQGEDHEADLLGKLVKVAITVDEARERMELQPLPDGLGAVLLDPTWMQNKQAADMAAQQAEMGEDGMGGDEDGEFGDPDDNGEGPDVNEHPRGGIDIQNKDGSPFSFDDDDDEPDDDNGEDGPPKPTPPKPGPPGKQSPPGTSRPGVAKSARTEVESGRRRYEVIIG